MLCLTIIRHAKSSWDSQASRDFDRPLNSRGNKDAVTMGKRLQGQSFVPDAVVSSTALRAMNTAALICSEIGFAHKNIDQSTRIYEATSADLQSLIESQSNSIQHLTIIAHNPGCEALCNYIEDGSVTRLTTCNVVHYELAIDDWKDFDRNCGVIEWHLTPKD